MAKNIDKITLKNFHDNKIDLTTLEVELSEEQFNRLQDHIKQCDDDDTHIYDEEFTTFMREIFYDHGDKIHWEDCDAILEIYEKAEDKGEDPNDDKVFTKYFNQYFKRNY